MYCIKCGKQIPEGDELCSDCKQSSQTEGVETTQDATQSQDVIQSAEVSTVPVGNDLEPSKKKNKGMLIACVVGGLAVLCAVGYMIAGSGKSQFGKIMETTRKAYSAEAKLFINQNAVLSKADSIYKKSSQTKLVTGFLDITASKDEENKVWALETQSPMIKPYAAYAASDKIIFGSKSNKFYEVNGATIADDVEAFAQKNGLQDSLKELVTQLKDSNITYSYESLEQQEKEKQELIKHYKANYEGVVKELANSVEVKKVKAAVGEGADQMAVDRLTFTISAADLNSWISTKLIPILSKDELLKERLDTFAKAKNTVDGKKYDYDSFIKDINELAEQLKTPKDGLIVIDVDCVDNVIVRLGTILQDKDNKIELAIGAIGKQHKLDNIFFETKENDKIRDKIEIKGEHIATDVFKSDIKTSIENQKPSSVNITWDTKANKDNFKVTSDSSEIPPLVLSVYNEGEKVVIKYQDKIAGTVEISALEAPITVPQGATPFKDATIEELSALIEQN